MFALTEVLLRIPCAARTIVETATKEQRAAATLAVVDTHVIVTHAQMRHAIGIQLPTAGGARPSP